MQIAITTALSLCLIGIVMGCQHENVPMIVGSVFLAIVLCIMTVFIDWSE